MTENIYADNRGLAPATYAHDGKHSWFIVRIGAKASTAVCLRAIRQGDHPAHVDFPERRIALRRLSPGYIDYYHGGTDDNPIPKGV